MRLILQDYPNEMLHILYVLLRQNDYYERKGFIFTMLLQLTELDNFQKTAVFGEKASYRCRDSIPNTLETRTACVTGQYSFGEYVPSDIDQLNAEQLRVRLRQQSYKIYQLETQLMESEYKAQMHFEPQQDPEGYFATMMMRPDTHNDVFDEILQRNYRVLALRYNPDKNPGTEELFKKIREAFEILSDEKKRATYKNSSRAKAGPQ